MHSYWTHSETMSDLISDLQEIIQENDFGETSVSTRYVGSNCLHCLSSGADALRCDICADHCTEVWGVCAD